MYPVYKQLIDFHYGSKIAGTGFLRIVQVYNEALLGNSIFFLS